MATQSNEEWEDQPTIGFVSSMPIPPTVLGTCRDFSMNCLMETWSLVSGGVLLVLLVSSALLAGGSFLVTLGCELDSQSSTSIVAFAYSVGVFMMSVCTCCLTGFHLPQRSPFTLFTLALVLGMFLYFIPRDWVKVSYDHQNFSVSLTQSTGSLNNARRN